MKIAVDAWDDVPCSAYFCTKYALRFMMEGNWGRIINIAFLASIAAGYITAQGICSCIDGGVI